MNKAVYYYGNWIRREVANDIERVYLFGDNIKDKASGYIPSTTQAVIRGLPNAIGIPTKKNRGNDDDSYFWDTDEDYELFVAGVDSAIKEAIATGKQIVIPNKGIGTGRAIIRGAFSKPGNRFSAYLNDKLDKLLRGINPYESVVGKLRIVNLRKYSLLPGERLIKVDRTSPLGNPYHMLDESKRDSVCDNYEKWFNAQVIVSHDRDTEFMGALYHIIDTLKSGVDVALGCWCVPKRCHAETIKNYIDKSLAESSCTTICFTGHRPNKLGGYDWTTSKNQRIMDALQTAILRVISSCPSRHMEFICGGALGIDQMAFEIVHRIKDKVVGKEIKLTLAMPFEKQDAAWFNQKDKDRLKRHREEADLVVMVDTLKEYSIRSVPVGEYSPAKMQARNRYMVDMSDIVIAVWDGTSGGTGNCVNYAQSVGKTIIRIDPSKL